MKTLKNLILERLKLTKNAKLIKLHPIIDDILISLEIGSYNSIKNTQKSILQDKFNTIRDDFTKLMKSCENAAYEISDWLDKHNINSLDQLNGPYEYIEDNKFFKHEGLASKFKYKKGLFVMNYNNTLKNVMKRKDATIIDLSAFNIKRIDNVILTNNSIYRYLENAGVLYWYLK